MSATALEVSPAGGVTRTTVRIPSARRRRFVPRRPGVNLLVFAVYSVISLIADLPVWPGDPSRVPTMLGEDIFQTAWFLEWTPYALFHGKNIFETTSLNYPVGVNLSQNTGMPLLGIITAPLTLLVSPIASENLLRFLAFSLSAYAAYWVLRKFVSRTPAAFVGGLLYGFSPYMVTQGSIHLNLMFIPLPPLLFYGLFELLVTQRSRPVRRGLLVGATAVAQYFISVEVLATTLLVAGITIFFLVFSCWAAVRTRARHAVVGLVVGAVVLGVFAAYPTWVMFFGPAHYNGPAQGYASVFNADLLGAAVPTTFQLLAPSHLAKIGSSLVGGQLQENGSYLGIPLIVICIGIVLRQWRKLWPVFLGMVAIVVWSMSLGPRLIVDGRVRSLPFDLPFRKLSRLPGFENILPVRFSLYVVFFASIIVAMGIDEYHRSLLARRQDPTRPGRRSALLGRGVIALTVVACVLTLLPSWPYQSFALRVNASERAKALRVIPTGSIVVTYPYPTTFYDAPMLWQALDGMRFRLVGGYALVPNRRGTATIYPDQLQPSIVESMLINSVSPVSVPGYATAVATSKTIQATSIVVDRDGATGPPSSPTTVSGVVIGTSPKTGMVYLRHGFGPIAIHVGDGTRYVERWAKVPSLAGVVTGELVTVTGKFGPGTVTPVLVGKLREFLRNAGVQAAIVGLGTTDAGVIAAWFRDALGPPTRAGGGAEIWTNVQVSDRHGA